MYCLKCGREYPPETEFCGDCGFLIAGERAKDRMLGAHFMQLVRVGNEMLRDEITAPLYIDVLDNMSSILDRLEEDLARDADDPELQKTPPVVAKVLEEPMKFARQGLDLYRQAIEILRSYLKDSKPETIHEGLALAEKADHSLTVSGEMSNYSAAALEKAAKEVSGEG